MKICPTCRRTYDDDALNFCLEDGTILQFSAADAAAPTIVMDQARPTDPRGAATQVSTPPKPYSMQPKKKSSKAWLWAVGILGLGVLLCGGGFVGFFVYVASVANTNSNSSLKTSPTPNNWRTNSTTSPSPSAEPSVTGTVTSIDLADWVKEFSVWGTTEMKDGEFLMAARQKGYYYVLVAPEDYKTDGATTRVTVRNPDNTDSSLGYGLIFHSDPQPLQNDYAFLIDSKKKRFRVVKHTPDSDEASVTPWTSSKLINEGTAENVLEVRDMGEKIDMYINGQLATSINNKKGPTSGVPGLYAGDGAKIGFKNLEIVK